MPAFIERIYKRVAASARPGPSLRPCRRLGVDAFALKSYNQSR